MGKSKVGLALVCGALWMVAACSSGGSAGRARSSTTSVTSIVAPTSKADAGHFTAQLVDGASGFAMSDGLRIHYEVHGHGKPLVLVHGWGASIKFNWQITGWLDALAKIRTVIAIDIRGHGDSDKPQTESLYGNAPMSDDIIAVMDHLGVEKADYIGYSLGAYR